MAMRPVCNKNQNHYSGKPQDQGTAQVVFAFVVFAIAVFFPNTPVYADPIYATTFGRMLCNAKDSISPIAPLISAIAYIAAAIITIRGTYLLKKHAEAPHQQVMSAGIWHVLGGGALASLPAFAGMLQGSFGLKGTGGASGCVPGDVVDASGGLDVMMQNFTNNISQPMTTLVSAIAIVVGLTYIFKGLSASTKIGTDPRAAAPTAIIVNLVIGAVLISIGSSLKLMVMSLFGGSVVKMRDFAGINWSQIDTNATNTAAIDKTVEAILMFIQVIGMIAFVRGWLVLKKAAEGGQATVAQGLTHLIGGAMAVNIAWMLKVMDNTFGTGILN